MKEQNEPVQSKIPLAGLFAALAVIFPIFFHMFGLGSAFLPMFLPVLMGSMLLPMKLALSVAVVSPVVSFIFTGMPPVYPPILPLMIVELLLVSFIGSYLYFYRHMSVWLTVIVAMLADRLALFLLVYWLAPLLGFPEKVVSVASVLHGIPGIIMICTVIPLTFKILGQRYGHILSKQYL